MTSASESANGKADDKSTETEKATAGKATQRQAKSSLVKSPEQEPTDIIVLADDSRVVLTDTLPNHRPIGLNDFEVVGSLSSAGNRPIMADTFEVFSTDTLPGHRPVAISTLPISELDFLPGNRPIAPNEVVDPHPTILMGYLD